MRPQLRLGIRLKVVLLLALTLLSSLTASSYLGFQEQARAVYEETERHGRELSELVAQTLAYHIVAYDYHTIERRLESLVQHEDIVYARVLSPRGNVMAEIGRPAVADPEIRLFDLPVILDGEPVGQLSLGMSTRRLRTALDRQKRNSQLRQTIVILLVLLGEFAALTYLVIRPLTRIAQGLRAMGADLNGTGRLPPLGRDEFGEIAERFNALLERLAQARAALEARVEAADRDLRQAYEQLAHQAEALRRQNAELEQLAVTDPLTGLYNKRYFEQLMQHEVRVAVRDARILSLMLIDIADFKHFNERYGLHHGDAVLSEVARRLASRTRRSDVLCRFGGDEFVLLLRGATAGEAIRIAGDLYQAVCDRPVHLGGDEVGITLSIGIATYPCPQPIESAETLFACADKALRAAKQQGPGRRIVHYAELLREADRRP